MEEIIEGVIYTVIKIISKKMPIIENYAKKIVKNIYI